MKEFSVFRIDEYIGVLDNRSLELAFAAASRAKQLFKEMAQARMAFHGPDTSGPEVMLNLPVERLAYVARMGCGSLEMTCRGAGRVSPSILYLIVTDSCNLQCRYCFIENDLVGRKKTAMPLEVARRAVSVFAAMTAKHDYGEEKPTIIFYGGEPLLNWRTLKGLLDTISREFPNRFALILNTNGVGLNDRIASKLAKHSVSVSLSVDGRPETNDSMRSYPDGSGSYTRVWQGYQVLKKMGVEVGLSVTVGMHNVYSLTDEVRWLLDEFQPSSIGINLPGTPATVHQETPPNHLVATKVLEVFELAREKGVYEDRVMRRLMPFARKQFYLKDCGAIGSQLVVRPDGKCGPCHALIHDDNYYTLDVFDGALEHALSDSPVFREWASRFPLKMPQCSDCDAVVICGGGCPYEALVRQGTIWAKDERNCVLNKMLITKVVRELLETSLSRRTAHAASKEEC
jgi:uncharacterized protein